MVVVIGGLVAVGVWYIYGAGQVFEEPVTVAQWEIVPFAQTDPGTPEMTVAVDKLSQLSALLNSIPLTDDTGRRTFPRNQAQWEEWKIQNAADIPAEILTTPWGNEVQYIFTHNHSSYMLNVYDDEGVLAVSYLGGGSHRVGPIPYQAPDMLKTPVGVALDNFIWNRSAWGSPVHNLVADAMRTMTGSNVALVNFLGIRANIPKGVVTREHLDYVMPFGNTAVVVEMSGAQLMDIIKTSLASPRPFIFSGIYATADGNYTTDGGNVIDATGEGMYRVAIPSYLADGGRYNEHADFASLRQLGGRRRLMADLVAEYITGHSPIEPDMTERLRQPQSGDDANVLSNK